MSITHMGPPTYELYRRLRQACGYDDDLAMVEAVWDNMPPEGRASAIAQYALVADKRVIELASHGDGWGTF